MPRTVIPVEELDYAGTAPPTATDSDATDDHEIEANENDGRVWLEIENTDASSRTVTIVIQLPDQYGLAVPDLDVAVPAGEVRLVPLPRAATLVRTGADTGKVLVNVTHDTVLKLRAYRLPRD
jgi:hypothetical protein